jgi:alpha-tubulin suppressor-like RCC1 family protein
MAGAVWTLTRPLAGATLEPMGWTVRKTGLVAGAVFLLAIVTISLTFGHAGRLRLPAGQGKPAISLGERHGLILASDGSLWSWGSDFLGWPVLGLGKQPMQSRELRRIGQETNWVGISAAASQNLAVKSDGTLWTWGESVGPRFTRPTPINSPRLAAPGNDWKQAAAGGVHSLAIKRDGTLWAWGNNWAGSVGIDATNGSAAPVQVGSATNWVRVWASVLESVGLQSDGSLWYWGDNLNPAFGQDVGKTTVPTRVSPDTNWVDVGFGVNTVFAIKSDGTLWVWGRQADVYTGASDPAQNLIPARVGTNSDWRSISACAGWWCQGLIKKDGSLWFLDASDGKPNGPRSPYQPVQFKRVGFTNVYAAYAAGATHAAAPGVHGPIGVVLTPKGEVWTWGMVLGDPPTLKSHWQAFVAGVAREFHHKATLPDPPPVFRDQPWELRNVQ